MSDKQEFWFAARTRKNQELTIRNSLEKLGVEHFLPMHTTIRQLRNRKKRVEVPIIRNLIFLRATKEKAMSLPNEHGIQLFYIRDHISHTTLVVPNKQMEDFMFVLNTAPDKVTFNDNDLGPGVKVQVIKGDLCGIEGEFAAMANQAYVIIRIPQILSVNIRLPKKLPPDNKIIAHLMNNSQLATLSSGLYESANRLLHLGEDDSPIFADDFSRLNIKVFKQTEDLFNAKSFTFEEEAFLCMVLLMGYNATIYDPGDKQEKIQLLLDRSFDVLPHLTASLLKCQLLLYCYGEVFERELLEEAREIILDWGGRELTEDEKEMMEMYNGLVEG